MEKPRDLQEGKVDEPIRGGVESAYDGMRGELRELYDSAELLGFAVFDENGEVLHNESLLSDEAAAAAVEPFVSCIHSLMGAERKVFRLSVELRDVVLVCQGVEGGCALFMLERDCDLDRAVEILGRVRVD